MSQVNYNAMSDADLKQYFLQHREDTALQAYLNRLNERPRMVITTPDDPDFDTKIQAAIRQQIQAKQSGKPAS